MALSLALLCDSSHVVQMQSKVQSYSMDMRHGVTAIINKTGLSRYMALKLIEAFDLDHEILWSGIGSKRNLSDVIPEIDLLCPQYKHCLLSPVSLTPRWLYKLDFDALCQTPLEHYAGDTMSPITRFVDTVFRDFLHIPRRGSHVWSWNNGIGSMMSASAVSLITESECSYPEVWAVGFSWKTIFSVLAHTVPIWLGGRGAADQWRSMGFDVFDDIVNHDYQYAPTLFQRCWQAVNLNRELLQDKAQLSKLKLQLAPRFKYNHLLLYQDVIGQYWYQKFSEWPKQHRQALWQTLRSSTEYELKQRAKGIKSYV